MFDSEILIPKYSIFIDNESYPSGPNKETVRFQRIDQFVLARHKGTEENDEYEKVQEHSLEPSITDGAQI